jgi:uncharacterized phage protein (TIGR02220 family)
MGFTKLDSGIVDSSVWSEPLATRVVWITILAKCDHTGIVRCSRSGLLRSANVPAADFDAAINTLESPDLESRTKDDEGRRIRPVEGGWKVINYKKYREYSYSTSPEAIRQRKHREGVTRHNVSRNVRDISASASAYASVIKLLNLKTGKHFSETPTVSGKYLMTRIAEGKTIEQFQHVINVKAAAWLKDPKMNAYLRPETLFGSKMESYLNEEIILSEVEKSLRVGARKAEETPAQKEREAKLKILFSKASEKIYGEFTPKIEAARAAGNIKDAKRLSDEAELALRNERARITNKED